MDTKPLPASSATRCSWRRLTAAGTLLAGLFLTGCAADDGGPPKKPLLPFSKSARDESIRKQAESDSGAAPRRTEQ